MSLCDLFLFHKNGTFCPKCVSPPFLWRQVLPDLCATFYHALVRHVCPALPVQRAMKASRCFWQFFPTLFSLCFFRRVLSDISVDLSRHSPFDFQNWNVRFQSVHFIVWFLFHIYSHSMPRVYQLLSCWHKKLFQPVIVPCLLIPLSRKGLVDERVQDICLLNL